MSGPERPPPSLGVIDEISTLGLKVTVLKTAMELDVFTTIASGRQHLEEITQATRCSIRGMRVLLDALCPLGLLSKSEGLYALTPTAQAYVVIAETRINYRLGLRDDRFKSRPLRHLTDENLLVLVSHT